MTFPMFTPIPKAKDTKENYQNKPLATGPYKFDSFTPGTELKLVKNTELGRQHRPGAPPVPGRVGLQVDRR